MEEKKKKKEKFSFKSISIDKWILLVVAGVLLLVVTIPDFLPKDTSPKEEIPIETVGQNTGSTASYERELENRLKELLSAMDGIGSVEVMVTISTTKERIIDKNTQYSEESVQETDANGGTRNSNTSSSKEDTVLINGTNGESPYIIKEIMPTIEGVVVVAQGADSAVKQSEISEAIQALFGISAHKIKVLKKKSL